jgi:ankyrin repeat protein
LGQGANVDACGFFGGTALHWAALNGHGGTVEFLKQSGARLDLRDEQFQSTPAEWAKEGGHDELAARLK